MEIDIKDSNEEDKDQQESNFYRFTAKLVLKVLAANHENSHNQKSLTQHFPQLRAPISFVQKIIFYYILVLWRLLEGFICSRPYLLLLGIFFLLWHPGLHYQPFPVSSGSFTQPPPKIAPKNSELLKDRVKLYILSDKSWVILYISGRQVASFPISVSRAKFSRGDYYVSEVNANFLDKRIFFQKKGFPDQIMMQSITGSKPHATGIFMDEDFWEILYPYLRPGVSVVIQ